MSLIKREPSLVFCRRRERADRWHAPLSRCMG